MLDLRSSVLYRLLTQKLKMTNKKIKLLRTGVESKTRSSVTAEIAHDVDVGAHSLSL